jgi:hypothetical protein
MTHYDFFCRIGVGEESKKGKNPRTIRYFGCFFEQLVYFGIFYRCQPQCNAEEQHNNVLAVDFDLDKTFAALDDLLEVYVAPMHMTMAFDIIYRRIKMTKYMLTKENLCAHS